jgi:predicted ATPase
MSTHQSGSSNLAFTVGLRNFRAFQNSGSFSIAPLTCIVGTNSSGKSSIITALLMLKQSLEQEAMGSRLSPLALSGDLCDLGNFTDVVFRHKEKSHIGIDFCIPFQSLWQTVAPYSTESMGRPIVSLAIPRSPLSRPIQRNIFYDKDDLSTIPRDGEVRLELSFATDQPFGPSLSALRIFIPELGGVRFVRTTEGKRTQHWRTYTEDIAPRALELRFPRAGFFPRVAIRQDEFQRLKKFGRDRVSAVHRASQLVFAYIDQILADSYSIGPFRTSPERRYSFGGFSSARGGKSGERTVDLLITEKLLKTPKSPLQRRVSYWLNHLHLAKEVSVADIARNYNLFSLNVGWSGRRGYSNIPDVGYGISQVLPILVQGLLMRPGGIYMVQQPELHLHPDAQAGLADFFLYLANRGIRVLVETHSEYLLIRLRLRMAQRKVKVGSAYYGSGSGDFKVRKESVSILLTEITRSGSRVKTVNISDTFQFENLPNGFMNQALEDRMALLNELT